MLTAAPRSSKPMGIVYLKSKYSSPCSGSVMFIVTCARPQESVIRLCA